MYGIIACNRGMWGCTSWCKRDGKPELYATKEEAQKVADEYNSSRPPINNFTKYFVEEYKIFTKYA